MTVSVALVSARRTTPVPSAFASTRAQRWSLKTMRPLSGAGNAALSACDASATEPATDETAAAVNSAQRASRVFLLSTTRATGPPVG